MEKFQDYAILQENLVLAIDQQPDHVQNELELNWTHKSPRGRASQLAQVIGPPNSIDENPGGVAIWKNVDPFFRGSNIQLNTRVSSGLKPTYVYSKLIIKDEEIPHLVPVP